jgi:diacylglycerol kinase
MKNHNKFSCFGNALKIIWQEKMFKVWLGICTFGITIGLIVGIGMTQLVLLVAIACIGLALEIANTGVEKMMDIIHPSYSEKVKVVKDLYAAVPSFVYSAYIISWLILVMPKIFEKVF